MLVRQGGEAACDGSRGADRKGRRRRRIPPESAHRRGLQGGPPRRSVMDESATQDPRGRMVRSALVPAHDGIAHRVDGIHNLVDSIELHEMTPNLHDNGAGFCGLHLRIEFHSNLLTLALRQCRSSASISVPARPGSQPPEAAWMGTHSKAVTGTHTGYPATGAGTADSAAWSSTSSESSCAVRGISKPSSVSVTSATSRFQRI